MARYRPSLPPDRLERAASRLRPIEREAFYLAASEHLAIGEIAARLGLTELVRTWGFITDSAADGEEALHRISVFRPTIIISDLVMPRMGGRQLAQQVRQLCPDIVVMFMSGYSEDETLRADATDEGDSYLPKPFSPATLIEAVNAVLA